MDLQELEKSDRIIYKVVAGSHMYGTNVATSDCDIRGVFVVPNGDFVCLDALNPPMEIASETQDTKYFEVRKLFALAMDCNPNVLELFWPPDDCILKMSPLMEEIIAKRSMFLSKKAAMAFVGYAMDQIAKATGQNKMVNNPEPEQEPVKEDHCWIIEDFSTNGAPGMPARPKPLASSSIRLEECHCSALEKVEGAYRLYRYGKEAKGVFRGSGMIVCESIPVEDEKSRFAGLLIYNKQGYEKAHKDWKRYWTWMKERNQARWIGQDGGKFQYDAKNMGHCMRLLLSGKSLITTGNPIVRFEGEQLAYLRKIRAGEFQYDEIMAKANEMIAEIDELTDKSPLPTRPNIHSVNNFYKYVRAYLSFDWKRCVSGVDSTEMYFRMLAEQKSPIR